MVQAIVKSFDFISVFYTCKDCSIWDCFDISWDEYLSCSDEELLDRYAII